MDLGSLWIAVIEVRTFYKELQNFRQRSYGTSGGKDRTSILWSNSNYRSLRTSSQSQISFQKETSTAFYSQILMTSGEYYLRTLTVSNLPCCLLLVTCFLLRGFQSYVSRWYCQQCKWLSFGWCVSISPFPINRILGNATKTRTITTKPYVSLKLHLNIKRSFRQENSSAFRQHTQS